MTSEPIPSPAAVPLRVLTVSGSPNSPSATRAVLDAIAAQLTAAGAQVDMLDLALEALLPFHPERSSKADGFATLKARVDAADVLLLGTPDYHGSFSSTLKNFLDHFWQEYAGKLFATVVASYDKGLTASDHLRTVARQTYAWSMPYALTFADKADVKDGQIINDTFRQRVEMFSRDLRVYGEALACQRRADLAGTEPGFLARLRKA